MTEVPKVKKLPDSEVFDRDDYDKLTLEIEEDICARLEKIMLRHRAARAATKEDETNPLEVVV